MHHFQRIAKRGAKSVQGKKAPHVMEEPNTSIAWREAAQRLRNMPPCRHVLVVPILSTMDSYKAGAKIFQIVTRADEEGLLKEKKRCVHILKISCHRTQHSS